MHNDPSKAVVHHIDYNTTHNDHSNLVVLCRDCHGYVHSKIYRKVLPHIEHKWAYVRLWQGHRELTKRLRGYYYMNDPEIQAFLLWRSLKLVNV